MENYMTTTIQDKNSRDIQSIPSPSQRKMEKKEEDIFLMGKEKNKKQKDLYSRADQVLKHNGGACKEH